jgi:hypothetical protein
MALGYGLDDQGFESRQGLRIFLFSTVSRLALGPTQPPIQLVAGALSLGVKRPGREADHSLYLMPRSRISRAIPPLPQYVFTAWCSLKAHEQLYIFTFTQLAYRNRHSFFVFEGSRKLNTLSVYRIFQSL